MSEGQTQEAIPIVFVRKHPDLEPILEELGPVLTSDDALQIDEFALLFGGITEPLTRTCEKGSARYNELKQDQNYVERAFQYAERRETNPIPVEDEFYWRETHPAEK